MLRVYSCLIHQHDLRFIALAVVVCGLASFTAITILRHACALGNWARRIWVAVAAVSIGFGVWATHFIAMIAYDPGLDSGYDMPLTLLSLAAAVALTGVGLGTALTSMRGARYVGGAIVGGGIAVMHYLGMAAYEVAGRVVWDPVLVAASILLGLGLGAVALAVGVGSRKRLDEADGVLLRRSGVAGAVLFTLAICSHHFTAMAAASLRPDPTIAVRASAIATNLLATYVFVAAVMVLILTAIGLMLDRRAASQRLSAASRLRMLADSAFEGLIVCEDEVVVTANTSLATLLGLDGEAIVGLSLSNVLSDPASRQHLLDSPDVPVETTLRRRDGETIPVELLQRVMVRNGRVQRVVALRDLRERHVAERHIRYLAMHDVLTGLPNRTAFETHADEVLATATGQVGLFCLDLDRFKEINDLFGPAAGDAALADVAGRLRALLGGAHMVARLGGDDFAVLVSGVDGPHEASRLADAMLDAVLATSIKGGGGTPLSVSIGIALSPDDGVDRAALMSHADTALDCVKAEGRGGWRFFEAPIGDALRERRHMEQELRGAIERGELSLAYQPQGRIDGTIIGFEALLRWTNARLGSVSPAVFIPLAEESNLILSIGEWVLRTACQEAANWRPVIAIAVNVSAAQLHDSGFAQKVGEILQGSGLPARRLELEITETALVRDLPRALATLRQLKALGISIAMDDFGTGYSSLSSLHAFPLDKIKIDASFIRGVPANEGAAAIVRAILALGTGLRLPVLAEGVETEDQIAFLHAEGCSEVQGYLLGKPQPAWFYDGLTRREAVRPPADAATAAWMTGPLALSA